MSEDTVTRPDAGTTDRPVSDDGRTTDPPPDHSPASDAETADESNGEDSGDAKLRREASRYRRQLRETETERDGLRGRVEAMQKAEVERLVADDLAVPTDLWLTGASLPDLLDDDGNVDQAKVADTVKAVLTERPGWRRLTHPNFDGGVRTAAPTAPTWADALRGKP